MFYRIIYTESLIYKQFGSGVEIVDINCEHSLDQMLGNSIHSLIQGKIYYLVIVIQVRVPEILNPPEKEDVKEEEEKDSEKETEPESSKGEAKKETEDGDAAVDDEEKQQPDDLMEADNENDNVNEEPVVEADKEHVKLFVHSFVYSALQHYRETHCVFDPCECC